MKKGTGFAKQNLFLFCMNKSISDMYTDYHQYYILLDAK